MQPNRRWVDVTMDSAVVRLGRGANGKLRLPKWKSGSQGGPQSSLKVHLIVRNATLITPEPELHAEGGHLDVIANTSPSRIDLVDLSWKQGPYGTALERLAGTYAVTDSVRFEVRELRSEELRLRASGAWPKGATERHAHVDIGRVRWRLLARLFDNKSFDVPGEGSAAIDLQGAKDWRGRFAAHVNWDSLKGDGEGATGKNFSVLPKQLVPCCGKVGNVGSHKIIVGERAFAHELHCEKERFARANAKKPE